MERWRGEGEEVEAVFSVVSTFDQRACAVRARVHKRACTVSWRQDETLCLYPRDIQNTHYPPQRPPSSPPSPSLCLLRLSPSHSFLTTAILETLHGELCFHLLASLRPQQLLWLLRGACFIWTVSYGRRRCHPLPPSPPGHSVKVQEGVSVVEAYLAPAQCFKDLTDSDDGPDLLFCWRSETEERSISAIFQDNVIIDCTAGIPVEC